MKKVGLSMEMFVLIVPLACCLVIGANTLTVTALKIYIHYADAFTPKTRCIIMEGVQHASSLLSLRSHLRSTAAHHIYRDKSACAFVYIDGPNAGRCGQISSGYSRDEYCGGARIPPDHLEGLQVFSYNGTEPLPQSLPSGRGVAEGTNFILYLTKRSSSLCATSLAHSGVCRLDDAVVGGVTSGRPIAGVINACWKEETDDIFIRRVIFHELLHLLAMNYKTIREFVQCEGNKSRKICWKLKDDVIRVTQDGKVVLRSRHFRRAVRYQRCKDIGHCQRYNDTCADCYSEECVSGNATNKVNVIDSLDRHGGVVLADSSTGVHWPQDLFGNATSIMVPQYMESGCVMLDSLTLALLKTSGWYVVNSSALPCITCFLNRDSHPYHSNCTVLKNNKNLPNQKVVHATREKQEQSTRVRDSEGSSGHKESQCSLVVRETQTHTQEALHSKSCNHFDETQDAKSASPTCCFPSTVVLILFQVIYSMA